MLPIKNDQILPYCHFTKIIKGFKRNKHKCNFHFVVMLMMTSRILKSMDFTKSRKSRYLENETLFFLQIKRFIDYILRATIVENSFVAEVTFNVYFKGGLSGQMT